MGLEERKQSRQLDGVTYEVTPLPFGVGKRELIRFIKLASPVISAAFEKQDSRAMAASIFGVVPDVLTDEDVDHFRNTFGPYSQFQQGAEWLKLTTAQQDLHFAGRYMSFMKWLAFCFEVNFSDFFAGIRDGAGVGAVLMGMKGQSQATG